MKKISRIVLLLLPVLFFFLLSFGKHCPKNNYLFLEYRGSQDKPIPHLILYTNTFDSLIDGYPYYSFKISEKNFNTIIDEIGEFKNAWKSPCDSVLGYYNYTIQADKTKQTYITDNKIDTKHLLFLIVGSIESKDVKIEIQEIIYDIVQRIW